MTEINNPIDRYWNPLLETLPLESLQRLQLAKFKKIIEHAFRNSKFHRRLYQQAGLEPGDIKTYGDIRRVPQVKSP